MKSVHRETRFFMRTDRETRRS